jgi:hypothetical protein
MNLNMKETWEPGATVKWVICKLQQTLWMGDLASNDRILPTDPQSFKNFADILGSFLFRGDDVEKDGSTSREEKETVSAL